ncbi:hypothetical protein ALC53_09987 [Atta colombica]|uniref:Uncharacterized protein n=1 Tax=Atta colombica TaxID=520822 RepID=A0A195B4X0_9HYME|nr:hypothetical protein ALC53_09987 [Atta colombica]
MFRAYGTAPAETPGADLYSWTTPIFNKVHGYDGMRCRCALAASRKSAKVRKINRHIYILRAFDVREEQARKNYATYIHHGTVISVVTDQLSEPIVYVSLNCAIVWYYSYSNLSFGYIYLKLLEFCDFSTIFLPDSTTIDTK